MRDAPARAVIGFDFGLKRIGIAVGDTLTARAAPRRAVAMLAGGPDWTAIERELAEIRPELLVVGEPRNADGTPGSLAPAARRFAQELAARTGLPVRTVDEHASSLEAHGILRQARAEGRRGRIGAGLDSAAAAVILERWLAGEGEQ
jgi:putative Holliday junction resolvase